ncbi:MAG: SDR family oxidoreductase [Spirochaetes bacterium]|nr:SDR family oxidoreductase [Spirochaetota bacterium]
MKVLFIGGTGNISTSVSRLAIEQGIDLFLLTRGSRKVKIAGANVITADIFNKTEILPLIKSTDWDVVVNWIAFTEDDVARDISLFRGRTRQYIFISSASAYQKPVSYPVITESTPLANPFWEYSRNKIAAEERLMKAYRDEGFPVTIIRPSHTYDTVIPVAIGGWSEYTIIDRMKKNKPVIVHGDGTSLWVLTHAEDFAKGLNGLFGNQQSIGHAFHITSDEILTWNQIYDIIAEAAGVQAVKVHVASEIIAGHNDLFTGELLGDKAHSVIFDNSKIKQFVPGFTATIPFYKGIRKTLEWFEEDASRQIMHAETGKFMDMLADKYGL